jgi:hypothetical protein
MFASPSGQRSSISAPRRSPRAPARPPRPSFGLDDLFALVVRPNPACDNAAIHASKAARATAVCPDVTDMPW